MVSERLPKPPRTKQHLRLTDQSLSPVFTSFAADSTALLRANLVNYFIATWHFLLPWPAHQPRHTHTHTRTRKRTRAHTHTHTRTHSCNPPSVWHDFHCLLHQR